jgi:hypothetical protein
MADSCGHPHAHAGLSAGALAEALEAAERACRADGERMTEPRRRVLELLPGAAVALSGERAAAVSGEERAGDCGVETVG